MNITKMNVGQYRRESNGISRAEKHNIWNKKIWLDGLNWKRENKDITIETIHNEVHRKQKGLKTMNRATVACRTVPEKQKGKQKIFEEITDKNFPNFMKNTKRRS